MRDEPADLPHDVVLGCLRRQWSLPAECVRYAPVGAGSYHWIGEAGGRPRWFVKCDRTDSAAGFERLRAAFLTAAALSENGLEFVLAPMPNPSGEPIVAVNPGWAMSVLPYLDGVPAGSGPWPDGEFRSIAAMVGRIHAAPVPDITPRWSPRTRWPLPDVDRPWTTGPFGERARRMIAEAMPLVERLTGHFRRLVAELGGAAWVVTHGEPHSANVIVTRDDRPYLIDWDSVRVAPRERDIRDLRLDAASLAAYATAAGTDRIRPRVCRLFQAEWDLDEISWFARCLAQPHADGGDARRAFDMLAVYLDIENRWPEIGG